MKISACEHAKKAAECRADARNARGIFRSLFLRIARIHEHLAEQQRSNTKGKENEQ